MALTMETISGLQNGNIQTVGGAVATPVTFWFEAFSDVAKGRGTVAVCCSMALRGLLVYREAVNKGVNIQ